MKDKNSPAFEAFDKASNEATKAAGLHKMDCWKSGGYYFIVIEDIDGKSLKKFFVLMEGKGYQFGAGPNYQPFKVLNDGTFKIGFKTK